MPLFPVPRWLSHLAGIQRISISELHQNMGQVRASMNRKGTQSLVVTCHNEDVFGVVTLHDLAILTALRSEPDMMAHLKAAFPELKEGPT